MCFYWKVKVLQWNKKSLVESAQIILQPLPSWFFSFLNWACSRSSGFSRVTLLGSSSDSIPAVPGVWAVFPFTYFTWLYFSEIMMMKGMCIKSFFMGKYSVPASVCATSTAATVFIKLHILVQDDKSVCKCYRGNTRGNSAPMANRREPNLGASVQSELRWGSVPQRGRCTSLLPVWTEMMQLQQQITLIRFILIM